VAGLNAKQEAAGISEKSPPEGVGKSSWFKIIKLSASGLDEKVAYGEQREILVANGVMYSVCCNKRAWAKEDAPKKYCPL
jgi:hypothetical protein